MISKLYYEFETLSLMGIFNDPELLNPSVHIFSTCGACTKLFPIKRGDDGDLDLSGRDCPHCGAYVNQQQVVFSYLNNVLCTSAIASSNRMQGIDPSTLIFGLVCVLSAWMGYPFPIRAVYNVIIFVPLCLILVWFYKYWYHYRSADLEYLEAVKNMRRSLYLWIATNIFCWSLLLIQHEFYGGV